MAGSDDIIASIWRTGAGNPGNAGLVVDGVGGGEWQLPYFCAGHGWNVC